MKEKRLTNYVADKILKSPDNFHLNFLQPKRPSRFQLKILKASEEHLCKMIEGNE
jgi:hypothetical protein